MNDGTPSNDSRPGHGPAPILVHIGPQKTGSTLLQEAIFSRPELGFATPLTRDEIVDRFIAVDDYRFDAGAAREFFEARCLDRGCGVDDIRVVSHESLSGNLHSGGHGSREILTRLVATFPEAVFVTFVREQASLSCSAYKQFVRDGGCASPKGYFSVPEAWSNQVPRFRFEHLEFDRIVDWLFDAVGRERTVVLPYEWFRRDPGRIESALSEACGRGIPMEEALRRRIRESHPIMFSTLSRLANMAFFRNSLTPEALSCRPDRAIRLHWFARRLAKTMPKRLRDRRESAFRALVDSLLTPGIRESNARLESMTGLPLRELGYRFPDASASDDS